MSRPLVLVLAEVKKKLGSDYHVRGDIIPWKINDLIYAQYVTYIGSEEGKMLDHDVWTGEKNPPRVAVAPLVSSGKDGTPSYVGWAVHTQKKTQLPV
jgi:hypothetical protein